MSSALAEVAGLFAQLSIVSVGGVNTVLPELQRQVVERHAWMSAREFAALYALAQAAPGPNMLVSTLIGWRVAGPAGAVVATLSLIAPSGLIAFFAARFWHRFQDRPWRRLIQVALLPVTAGMVLSAAFVLCRSTSVSIGHAAFTLFVAAVLLATRLHPLWMLGLGAVLGMSGII